MKITPLSGLATVVCMEFWNISPAPHPILISAQLHNPYSQQASNDP
jgi:hypothetical protein